MLGKGMVFSILRGSLYDGPGVRTTVFLKGCPLHCLWCHNPEGISGKPQLGYFAHRCIGCGRCREVCPQGVHRLCAGQHAVRFDRCVACGACAAVCPSDALVIYGVRMRTEEVMRIVRQDKAYYATSGGGITLSGGEPLSQPDFALKLLLAAGAERIHTCVETSGSVAQEQLERVLPAVDLFLFDYKESSPKRHKRYTGCDNAQILENLDFLYRRSAQIILRCPIIPGYNDSQEHFEAISGMKRKYPALAGIEIMPYHDMGKGKAAAIGHGYELKIATVTQEQKQAWKEKLNQNGDCIRIN